VDRFGKHDEIVASIKNVNHQVCQDSGQLELQLKRKTFQKPGLARDIGSPPFNFDVCMQWVESC
jgi:hypothetical protein